LEKSTRIGKSMSPADGDSILLYKSLDQLAFVAVENPDVRPHDQSERSAE
jgi:hypothetical protein